MASSSKPAVAGRMGHHRRRRARCALRKCGRIDCLRTQTSLAFITGSLPIRIGPHDPGESLIEGFSFEDDLTLMSKPVIDRLKLRGRPDGSPILHQRWNNLL